MSNYQVEIDAFKNNFAEFKEQNIVLYGIGRRTATLLPGIKDWNVVGLMDKDPENIGKELFGYPVIDAKTAEDNADLIIINAPQAYWDVIYARISDVSIPVYNLDGTLAKKYISEYENNLWWNESEAELTKLIERYDIISFDIYDTLVQRKVYMPQDIWRLVDIEAKHSGIDIPGFREKRKAAIALCEIKYPNIYEIYETISKTYNLERTVSQKVCDIEINIEENILVPRNDMVGIAQKAMEMGKEVFIVSDMHLPKDSICRILATLEIEIDLDHIYLSNDKRAEKADGSMWKLFKKAIKGRKHLHIGDDAISDVQMAKENGIDSYRIVSANELMKNSFLTDLVPRMCTEYACGIVGLINANVFADAFKMGNSKGKVYFDTPEKMGYILFGPVIYTFLRWIKEEVKERDKSKIYFMARDGFFLFEDFKYLLSLSSDVDNNFDVNYLQTSRRSTMVPNIVDKESLDDVIRFPYNGTFREFMEDRFSIEVDERSDSYNETTISTVNDFDMVSKVCGKYYEEILEEAETERRSYLNYLNQEKFDNNGVVVDLFFYGNTQYYLSKLINSNLTGLYIACDISDENRTTKTNTLIPCFHKLEDVHGTNSQILKYCLLIESFLTAPNGMLLKIDPEGKFIFAVSGKNQEDFDFRIKINEGVKTFIKDANKVLANEKCDPYFVDQYYGEFFKQGIIASEEMKKRFYFDNALIQRREMQILE